MHAYATKIPLCLQQSKAQAQLKMDSSSILSRPSFVQWVLVTSPGSRGDGGVTFQGTRKKKHKVNRTNFTRTDSQTAEDVTATRLHLETTATEAEVTLK